MRQISTVITSVCIFCSNGIVAAIAGVIELHRTNVNMVCVVAAN